MTGVPTHHAFGMVPPPRAGEGLEYAASPPESLPGTGRGDRPKGGGWGAPEIET